MSIITSEKLKVFKNQVENALGIPLEYDAIMCRFQLNFNLYPFYGKEEYTTVRKNIRKVIFSAIRKSKLPLKKLDMRMGFSAIILSDFIIGTEVVELI